MNSISAFLLFPSLMLVLYMMLRDLGEMLRKQGLASIWKREQGRQILLIPVLVLLAVGVAYADFHQPQWASRGLLWAFSGVIAFLISLFWLLYLNWLDLYEREHPGYLILTFVMGCATVGLVFPLGDFVRSFNFEWREIFFNDFAYSFIAIGLVEELVKFIPWFLIWRFTRQIDEPFDFILYASVSALGFAFIENILYLQQTGLQAVYARALYSSVAHMFFSSIIAYGVVWLKLRGRSFHPGWFLLFWALAGLAHGFYNFWLLSDTYRFELITFLFFLATIHLWVVMKNNLINLSTFYDPSLRLQSEVFMYRLINLMLGVLLMALLGHNILNRGQATLRFFLELVTNYTYVFAYIAISFSSYLIIPGYRARFTLPHVWMLPRHLKHPNLRGQRLHFGSRALGRRASRQKESLDPLRGRTFTLERRVVFDGDPYWYLIKANDAPVLVRQLQAISPEPDNYAIRLLQPVKAETKAVYSPKDVRKLGVLPGRFFAPRAEEPASEV